MVLNSDMDVVFETKHKENAEDVMTKLNAGQDFETVIFEGHVEEGYFMVGERIENAS